MPTRLLPSTSQAIVHSVAEPPSALKFNLRIESNPSGTPITVDGVAATTPYFQALTVGIHTISAPATASAANLTYGFNGWSDGIVDTTRTVDLSSDAFLFFDYVSPVGVVVGDAGFATDSLSVQGGQKLVVDPISGVYLAFYTDSSGRVSIAMCDGDPTVIGWAPPFKSTATGNKRIAAVHVGGTAEDYLVLVQTGQDAIAEIIARVVETQEFVFAVEFSAPAIVDSPGTSPTAIRVHDGAVWAVWNKLLTGASSRLVAGYRPPGGGWILRDIAVDTTVISPKYPVIVQRGDNRGLHVVSDSAQATSPRNMIHVMATYDPVAGAWTWLPANLTFQTDVSRGLEDAPDGVWDAVGNHAVFVHDVSGLKNYRIVSFDASGAATFSTSPTLPIVNNEWGVLRVDEFGSLDIVYIDEKTTQQGNLNRVRVVGGAWQPNAVVDAATNLWGLSARKDATRLEVLYGRGLNAPVQLVFRRIA